MNWLERARLEFHKRGSESTAERAEGSLTTLSAVPDPSQPGKSAVATDVDVEARRVVFAQQWASTRAPRVPAFLFKASVPYVLGWCFSCGDALERLRFDRCPRCAIAWRLAAGVPISAALAEALDSARLT